MVRFRFADGWVCMYRLALRFQPNVYIYPVIRTRIEISSRSRAKAYLNTKRSRFAARISKQVKCFIDFRGFVFLLCFCFWWFGGVFRVLASFHLLFFLFIVFFSCCSKSFSLCFLPGFGSESFLLLPSVGYVNGQSISRTNQTVKLNQIIAIAAQNPNRT